MAIVRLSIEVLQGRRDGDDPDSHAAAVEALRSLQADVSGVAGITLYPEETEAPWGQAMRPGTFNVDFDTELPTGVEGDREVLAKIVSFLTDGRGV